MEGELFPINKCSKEQVDTCKTEEERNGRADEGNRSVRRQAEEKHGRPKGFTF